MDAFKAAEIERMREGGNKRWKEFFDNWDGNKMAGITYVCIFVSTPLLLEPKTTERSPWSMTNKMERMRRAFLGRMVD